MTGIPASSSWSMTRARAGAGEDPPVERRCVHAVVVHEEDAGAAGLEHTAVVVEHQHVRILSGTAGSPVVGERTPIGPLVLAQPARDDPRDEDPRVGIVEDRARRHPDEHIGRRAARRRCAAGGDRAGLRPCDAPPPRVRHGRSGRRPLCTDESSLATCASTSLATPSTTSTVSKMPSDRSARSTRALDRDMGRHRLVRCFGRQVESPADGLDQRPRLDEALGKLALRCRVRDDAAADAEPHAVTGDLERADRDVELEPRRGADVPDRTGVRLTRRGFELGGDLHRPHLGRSRDRAGREGGAQQVGVGDVGPEVADDVGDQVPDGVPLGPHEGRHPHAAGCADATEVVAHEVDDHHVLGPVLRRRRQLVGVGVEGCRALDRRGEDLVARASQEQLGREARDRALGSVDERGVRRGQRLDAGAEQVERIARERRLEPRAEIDLEDVAGADVLERASDGRRVRVGRRRHGERADAELRRPGRLGQRVEHVGVVEVPLAGVPGRGRRGGQSLEPPHAVGESEHPVVERDPRVWLRHGPVRGRRQIFDEATELVAPRPRSIPRRTRRSGRQPEDRRRRTGGRRGPGPGRRRSAPRRGASRR